MSKRPLSALLAPVVVAVAVVSTGCGGGGDAAAPAPSPAPITITPAQPNAVSYWNEVATATINQPASAGGTPEEARPNLAVDLATVHIAIYDAVAAIDGTYRPFATTPTTPSDGASLEAATAAAAHSGLQGLYPSRAATYQAAYDTVVAALPSGAATTRGLALGAEVGAKTLSLRANDGRSVALAPFVSGTSPGQFRTATNPVGRENPFIRPFVLNDLAQFRAPSPPALDSAEYAADVNETGDLGRAGPSDSRDDGQTETARFHSEPPFNFWPRNMRTFATTHASLADQARLLAMIWVTQADAQNACFESKYTYLAWRPVTAITLDGDGNPATEAEPAWTPLLPTPNHPEYPAAHGCIAGAMAELLRLYYGTSYVTFEFTSTVTGSTHRYTSTMALDNEIYVARIAGGMHFRSAIAHGKALGAKVADWVVAHAFQRR
jgi:hypothetical protein